MRIEAEVEGEAARNILAGRDWAEERFRGGEDIVSAARRVRAEISRIQGELRWLWIDAIAVAVAFIAMAALIVVVMRGERWAPRGWWCCATGAAGQGVPAVPYQVPAGPIEWAIPAPLNDSR
jgi:hypothetical protein